MKAMGRRRALRHFGLWLGIGWALVAMVVYLSLTPAPPQAGPEGSDKLGHVLAYAVLMGWFGQLYERPHWLWALGFLALGIGLEFIQATTGYRSYEYADMLADGIGVLLGWLTVRIPLGQQPLAWLDRRL